MFDYNAAAAYVAAVTRQDPSTAVIDIRFIHDTDKTVKGYHFRGTLLENWPRIQQFQSQGFGCFMNANLLDGRGRNLENVQACRVHVIDLDKDNPTANYQRAADWVVPPSFAVQSSPGKFHVYWHLNEFYNGNEFFTDIQRKLRQLFQGDKAVVDPTRVLRLPGTYNMKYGEPQLVTCWAMDGFNRGTTYAELVQNLANIHVHDGGSGVRKDLGDPALAAPSLAWLERVLELTDPNTLPRDEWVSFMAAIKQAGWTLTDPLTLRAIFDRWCARYAANDIGENEKQWNSIRNTEVGWPSLERRVPQIKMDKYAPVAPVVIPPSPTGQTASVTASPASGLVLPQVTVQQAVVPAVPPVQGVSEPPPLDCSGEMLTYIEQKEWFAGCTYVVELKKIMTSDCEFLDATGFNVVKGGKIFIWNSEGKVTDEAWKAATRGTQFRIPRVHHIRFVPARGFQEIITDELGRRGINVYKPVDIRRVQGDPTPFLRHIDLMLPNRDDQKILLDYLAHNIKYPGVKIPWAPVIQSVEGVGKGVLKRLMRYCVGGMYFHAPNAKDLGDSGAKFNAWMRAKLFILADEIKVDDRRDMIEVLKPMLSEEEIEVQAKGYDQKVEDNYANWMFFTNYKDAVPINKNSRRFCIFYSAFQSKAQLKQWGMGKQYFDQLYSWMKGDGCAILYDFFMNYPIERGAIPMDAPNTSSHTEVLKRSMGATERLIHEAVTDGIQGFRNGWVSAVAVRKRMTEVGVRALSMETVEKIISEMGYVEVGRSEMPYIEEDLKSRTTLFHVDGSGNVSDYARDQGYHT